MPNVTPLPTSIHIEFPYDVTITTKEEAVDYVINQCKNCPRYIANWDCSGKTLYKCITVTHDLVNNVREQFHLFTNERL